MTKNKKILASIFIAALIFSVTGIVKAQGNSKNNPDNKGTTTPKKIESRSEARVRFMRNLEDKQGDKIEKLEKVANRISERISELESRGYKMDDPKKLMNEANLKIATAKQKFEALKVAVVSAIQFQTSNPSSNVASKLAIIRNEGKKTRDAIKEAHRSLVKVIASIKSGLRKGKTATSTPATMQNTGDTQATTTNQ